jgi:hypothetical protein
MLPCYTYTTRNYRIILNFAYAHVFHLQDHACPFY